MIRAILLSLNLLIFSIFIFVSLLCTACLEWQKKRNKSGDIFAGISFHVNENLRKVFDRIV